MYFEPTTAKESQRIQAEIAALDAENERANEELIQSLADLRAKLDQQYGADRSPDSFKS